MDEEIRARKIIETIIGQESKRNRNFFFIQIGSNDGITSDPIKKFVDKFRWRGILIEPVITLFEKLKKNYQYNNNLIFENIAIAKESGETCFYRIKENNDPNVPEWYYVLGSIIKEHLIKHKKFIPDFEKYFIEEKIKCVSFMDLIKKYNVRNIDLLNIDTEGYDFEIIKTINFKKIRPKMILYEHRHLDEEDKIKSWRLLKKNGYLLIIDKYDTFAYTNRLKSLLMKIHLQ